MPSASSFIIPLSTSGNGSCKTNLRGLLVGTADKPNPYDFVSPSRIFTTVANISSDNSASTEPWGVNIQKAYGIVDEATLPQLSYGTSRFSSSTSGTLLIRLFIQPRTTYPPSSSDPIHVFYNGDTAGYGLYLTYEPGVGKPPPPTYKLFFTDTVTNDIIQVSDSLSVLSENTWYHFGIRFETTGDGVDTPFVTKVSAFQNGISTVVNQGFPSGFIQQPTGFCTFYARGTLLVGYSYYGKITDFAFLEAQLSDSQITNIATAGYV